ncbi:MAG: MaoC family dehydratase N-terminal domain-containing protein [Nocardiopsaceae bacterium]|nr:MaoC family dehydratase N-terminal domain-containing protein [Nocardiopsaceae bacterium]
MSLTRRVDPWPAEAFAGLIGTAPPPLGDGDPLPPLWHWFTLLEHPATREIGADGHPAAGPFLPPVPGRRRMIAGGRFRLHGPIPVGARLSAASSVTNVTVKRGRTGELAFVTVRHELSADGDPAGAEEQDVVYRAEPPGPAPRPGARPVSRPEDGEPEPAGDWRLAIDTDPVLLFRFSALTYNGHRIHYDRDYATAVEGYPDLVIHGPLLALLALELPRLHAPDRTVTAFGYRLTRPAFAPARLVSAASPPSAIRNGERPNGERPIIDIPNEVHVTVAASGASPSLTGKVTLS